MLFIFLQSITRYFNSRPSARGDHTEITRRKKSILFQFTPLREGRRLDSVASTDENPFQFTPLREGRR